jgi:aspartate carbamoyltransferase catalytic subunit
MSARHLLSIDDLCLDELLTITDPHAAIRPSPPDSVRGTLAFLFQQPSLRTMSSFASAGTQLGLMPVSLTTTGGFRDQLDVEDEIRQLGLTSACVVARTAQPMSPDAFRSMTTPVVSAGDGSNEHPTQTLLDLTTLRRHGLPGKRVVLMGNLRDHRVYHSLVRVLQLLEVDVRLLCPPDLAMPARYLRRPLASLATEVVDEADEALSAADFIYIGPTQHYANPTVAPGAAFCMNLERARRVLKPGAILLHPFPRLTELSRDLDGTSFDGYHAQTAGGPEVRRRVLSLLLQ